MFTTAYPQPDAWVSPQEYLEAERRAEFRSEYVASINCRLKLADLYERITFDGKPTT